ncbi:MAG: alpha/beta hydrolase [Spirochaetes bacterium]|nr:alpha/beta hydrolase [Spirochaetota bacterium]
MKAIKNILIVFTVTAVTAIVFFIGLLAGGRAGYFLCFGSNTAGYAARSHELKSCTKNVIAISYGKDPRNKLDIYLPDRRRGRAPVLVFFHGGRWTLNSKDTFSFIAKPYLDCGIIFISAGYRLSPEHPFPAPVVDCQRVVQWTYRNIGAYGGDPERIFLSGHSAGAHLCSLITANDTWIEKSGLPQNCIKGCIVVSGPTDLNLLRFREVSHFVPDGSLLDEASPVFYIKRGLPAFLVVYGTGDIMVPPRIPREFIAKCRRHSVPVYDIPLMLRTHSQTLEALGDPNEQVVSGICAFINGDGIRAPVSGDREMYEKLESEAGSGRDIIQKLIITVFTKAR